MTTCLKCGHAVKDYEFGSDKPDSFNNKVYHIYWITLHIGMVTHCQELSCDCNEPRKDPSNP